MILMHFVEPTPVNKELTVAQQDSVDQIQLALDSSSPTPGTSDSISIEISGLASGDSLSLYSTKDCSGTALTTTTNTPVAVSGLAEGSHVFHFKITAAADSSVSDCSKSFLSYHYDATDPPAVTLSLASDFRNKRYSRCNSQ